MKHIFSTLFFTCGLVLATSCSSNGEPEENIIYPPGVTDPNFEIVVSSTLGDMSAVSRAAISPSDSTNRAISVFRVDQVDDDSDGIPAYPAISTFVAPKDAILDGRTVADAAVNATISFDPATQYYLANGWKTSVLAVHPQLPSNSGAWDASKNELTYTIDGKTDIMVTKWGEGYKDLTKVPAVAVQPQAMSFEHLLAQVRVRVFAQNLEARDYWGDIQSVTVTGRETDCTLTLPAIGAGAGSDKVTLAATSDDGAFPMRTIGTTGDDKGKDITGTLAATAIPYRNAADDGAATKADAVLLGHAMIVPVGEEGSEVALPLTIVSKKDENTAAVTTYVTVPAAVYAAGNAYNVVLKLSAMEIIPQKVTITEWVEQEDVEVGI